jgi:hypothetical protein
MLNRNGWIVSTLVAAAALSAAQAVRADDNEPASPAAPAFRLMSADKQAALRKLLPRVESARIEKLLADERTIFYTEAEMPRCHQDWDGSLPGIHSAYYNISANGSEPFGNGNREFPWGHPAGTHRSASVYTFRFVALPQDEHGDTLPVAYYRKHLRGDVSQGYAWVYPVGTIFGEVLCHQRGNGTAVAFELRIRERAEVRWEVDVFRPFPTAESLAKRIEAVRPNWADQPALAALVAHLTSEQELPEQRLSDNHSRQAFSQLMGVDKLPALDDEALVLELLTTTPFVSAHGELWRKGTNGAYTAAPTTEASFHIVPKNYDAGFIEVDTHSCMRCHETANQHVRDFDFGRDWYGRIRGSDGIFSWHPFDPAGISGNGFGAKPRIRAALVEAGIVAPYDAKVHTPEHYVLIRGLDR